MLEPTAPGTWVRFDPARGALDRLGRVVHTLGVLPRWQPDEYWSEAGLNRLRIEKWSGQSDSDALLALRIERAFNLTADVPRGTVLDVDLDDGTRIGYVRTDIGYERLGGIS